MAKNWTHKVPVISRFLTNPSNLQGIFLFIYNFEPYPLPTLPNSEITVAGCRWRSSPRIWMLRLCIHCIGRGFSRMAWAHRWTSWMGICCTKCCASQNFCSMGFSSSSKWFRRSLTGSCCGAHGGQLGKAIPPLWKKDAMCPGCPQPQP